MDSLKSIISNEGTSKWKTFIYLVGLIFILNKSTKLLCFLIKVFFRKQKNFIKRYGENTYALITGASDGKYRINSLPPHKIYNFKMLFS